MSAGHRVHEQESGRVPAAGHPRVQARRSLTRQVHTLTSRADLDAGQVCWRMTSRWREENYFRHARTWFALDVPDTYAVGPDDPDRMVPNPPRRPRPTAAGPPARP